MIKMLVQSDQVLSNLKTECFAFGFFSDIINSYFLQMDMCSCEKTHFNEFVSFVYQQLWGKHFL